MKENYKKVDTKALESLEKKAERAEWLAWRMNKLVKQLQENEESAKWVDYLSETATEMLTADEVERLNKANATIKEAKRWINLNNPKQEQE